MRHAARRITVCAMALALCGVAMAAQASVEDESVLWSSADPEPDPQGADDDGEAQPGSQPVTIVRCHRSDAYCGTRDVPTRTQSETLAATLGETILEVEAWFEETGLLPSLLPFRRNVRRIRMMEGYVSDGVYAQVRGAENTSSMELEVGTVALERDGMRSTLAHEWFHTAVSRSHDRRLRPPEAVERLHEALAEAVGMAFSAPGAAMIDKPPREMNLHRPFFHESDRNDGEGYEKAPYFLFVGERLGATNTVGYMKYLMDDLSDDNHKGMTHLYGNAFVQGGMTLTTGGVGSLVDATFDKAFPAFIALLNQPQGEHYFGAIRQVSWDAGSAAAPQPIGWDIAVAPFAATPLLLDPITASDIAEDPQDRLVVASVEIDENALGSGEDPTDHVRLAFEHELIEGNSHRWLMRLDETNTGPFLRLANAGPSPDETAQRRVRLRAKLTPATFVLPQCVNPGTQHSVTTRGASVDDLDNFKLRADAGEFDGLTFTAPEHPGEVEVTLVIESPITRSDSLAEERRPDIEVPLGSIEVVAEHCMIRMQMSQATMIYSSARGGFTAVTTPHQPDLRIVVSTDEFMARVPGQGWMRIPAATRQKFLRDLGNAHTLGGAVPGEPTTPFTMADLPLQMTRHLSWDQVQRESERLGIEPVIARVGCPGGAASDTCVSASHAQGELVYDRSRRLVAVRGGGHEMTFEYGAFDIATPPGW